MIKYKKQAEKFLLSQDKAKALHIYNEIEKLPLGDVKRLQGSGKPPLFRLRIGKVRAIFCYEDDYVVVLKIDYRGDAYK
ncbi:MAG: type II toxin-antitoxin system RelE/ParE family toxin [Defluviitaleaceae bacterium]|nr:type II toxin-antitoxin system RelE/ParE family toxin [Defluviitaleaceae bacterium]